MLRNSSVKNQYDAFLYLQPLLLWKRRVGNKHHNKKGFFDQSCHALVHLCISATGQFGVILEFLEQDKGCLQSKGEVPGNEFLFLIFLPQRMEGQLERILELKMNMAWTQTSLCWRDWLNNFYEVWRLHEKVEDFCKCF